jgi:uncharacterized protein YjdB/cytoskeletal protein RodZ
VHQQFEHLSEAKQSPAIRLRFATIGAIILIVMLALAPSAAATGAITDTATAPSSSTSESAGSSFQPAENDPSATSGSSSGTALPSESETTTATQTPSAVSETEQPQPSKSTETATEPSTTATTTSPVEAATDHNSEFFGGYPNIEINLDNGATLSDIHKNKEVSWGSHITVSDPATTDNSIDDAAAKVKGRGNSTWTLMAKKPYQIKFEKKTSMLGMPKAKKWILLANHADATFLRNLTAFTIANNLGLAATPQESRYVNLFVNGKYLGLYQLTEKVEIGSNRLDIDNDQAVMAEMDNTYGYHEPESLRFKSKVTGTTFVLKDQNSEVDDNNKLDEATAAGWSRFQSSVNKFEELLYAKKPNWKAISSAIDVDSFARFYLLEEFAEDSDVSVSSIYYFQDGPNDKIHAGPAWDFDITLGNCDSAFRGASPKNIYVVNTKWFSDRGTDWYTQLFRNPEFVRIVNEIWAADGAQSISKAIDVVQSQESLLASAATANFEKWPSVLGHNSVIPQCDRKLGKTYNAEVTRLLNWLQQRLAYMDTILGGTSRPILSLAVHTQSHGWWPTATGGMMQGTTGQSKRLEAFQMNLLPGTDGEEPQGYITADSQGFNGIWQGWSAPGKTTGVVGKSQPLQALRIKLVGKVAQQYDVYYRVYVQSYGWLDWVKNGQLAGTISQNKRIEAMQVVLSTPTDEKTTPNADQTQNQFYLNDNWTGKANIEFAWGAPSAQVFVGDWDGDGKDTVALRRGNTFAFTNETDPHAKPQFTVVYGKANDTVIVGDWDGDGKDTLAVRRGIRYYIRNTLASGNADKTIVYGKANDTTLVGDWNGDGKDTLGVRRIG